MTLLVNWWLVLIGFWLLVCPVCAQRAVKPAGTALSGMLIDHNTKRPLGNGRIVATTPMGNVPIGISDETGKFSGVLSNATTGLSVVFPAYQSQFIPVQPPADNGSESVMIIIPLLPVATQVENRPYQQTQQTAYLQEASMRSSASDTTNVQHGVFRVFDAVDNKPLPATVCFFFTRSSQKKCLTATASGLIALDFREKDIVAIEATSPNHQPYAGNLVIDQFGGRSLQHPIPMNRTLTILAVQAEGAARCTIQAGPRTWSLTTLQAGRFVAYNLAPGPYALTVFYGKRILRSTGELRSGLNWTSIVSGADTIAALNKEKQVADYSPIRQTYAERVRFDSIPMIYFEQSSYSLKFDAQQVLYQVAHYMKANPNYTLEITGHTDNVGTPSLNQTLSMYRAMVTASFLSQQGVNDNRISKVGLGGSQPLVANDTEANRARNRRVYLKLVATR